MNVAVIGCGYIGVEVARLWQQSGFFVTATTTSPERVTALEAIASQVVVLKGNNLVNLQAVVQAQETVLLSVGAANPNVYAETYLQTAQTLISVLKTSSVKQIIYTGSYAVYGDRGGEWVDELSSVAPANSNGQILCDTEQVLLSASTADRNVCILRLGGIYGPGRELAKIFGRVAGTTRPGKGDDAVNWIHRDDIVTAIEYARTHKLQGIYNLVDDTHLNSRELLDSVCEQHHLPKVRWDESLKSTRPYNARVSNQKIKDTGYKLIHPQMSRR